MVTGVQYVAFACAKTDPAVKRTAPQWPSSCTAGDIDDTVSKRPNLNVAGRRQRHRAPARRIVARILQGYGRKRVVCRWRHVSPQVSGMAGKIRWQRDIHLVALNHVIVLQRL